jgi:hypothetical protein
MAFAAGSITAKSGKMEMQLGVTIEGKTRQIGCYRPGGYNSCLGNLHRQTNRLRIKPYSGGPAGTVKVADRETFCFDLVGIRAGAQPSGAQTRTGDNDATNVPGCVDKSTVKPDSGVRPL